VRRWYTLLTFLIPTCSEQAFDFLEKYLALTEPPPRPTLADCDRGGLTTEALIDMATYAYNACINTLGEIYVLEPQAKPLALIVYVFFPPDLVTEVDSQRLAEEEVYCIHEIRDLISFSFPARDNDDPRPPQGSGSADRPRGSREEEEIEATKAMLQALYQRSRGVERGARGAGLRTPVFATLNSGGQESPASALILGLISNLNTVLGAVQKGLLFR
jgi:hypothetical protein